MSAPTAEHHAWLEAEAAWHGGTLAPEDPSAGLLPFYGPYGDIKDVEGCDDDPKTAEIQGSGTAGRTGGSGK